MQQRRYLILLFFLCFPLWSLCQGNTNKVTIDKYINLYKDIAIKKMREHRIPASITLAQGILESSNGNSDLAVNANNHFGIKCHDDWTGETYIKDDDARDECFRKYRTAEESFEDHSRFLCTRPRYAFLFNLDVTDYNAWAYGLKKAGYATNPQYPQQLIKIIEENRLFEFDHVGSLPLTNKLTFSVDSLPSQYKALTGRSDFNEIVIGGAERKIWKNNRVKFTLAKKGDNVAKLAKDLDMMPWQLYRYNELSKNDKIIEGQIVYLQPKRRKAEKEFHSVQVNETMYTIAQLYGIKLKQLYRKNRMQPGNQLHVGQKLWLRKTKPVDKSS